MLTLEPIEFVINVPVIAFAYKRHEKCCPSNAVDDAIFSDVCSSVRKSCQPLRIGRQRILLQCLYFSCYLTSMLRRQLPHEFHCPFFDIKIKH